MEPDLTPKGPTPDESEELTHPENIVDDLGGVPLIETESLYDAVLAAATIRDPYSLPPEVDETTVQITEWDSPPGQEGHQAALLNEEDEESVAGKLVQSGLKEADRELRVAAAEGPDQEDEL